VKNFLQKSILFLLIPAIVLFSIAYFTPTTPRAATSLLFSQIDKEQLLKTAQSPRIILIGGSNLSFGINSSLIEKELEYNPVNTGIHATIGLKFMMDNVIDHVRPGDIVVLIPEYSQYFGRYAYGGEELLRIVFDVNHTLITKLGLNQWINIIKYIPEYSLSKFELSEYRYVESDTVDVYERRAFNEYGDVDIHWIMEGKDVEAYKAIESGFNKGIIREIISFEEQIQRKGAEFFITFPGLQDKSYDNMSDQISIILKALNETDLIILGSPEEFKMAPRYMFNTPYHLNKAGTDFRTKLLIEDLLNVLE